MNTSQITSLLRHLCSAEVGYSQYRLAYCPVYLSLNRDNIHLAIIYCEVCVTFLGFQLSIEIERQRNESIK